jgi:hypothetical protein
MKKTSLVLAISALLYGTSGTYTFAIDLDTILSQIDTQTANEPSEDAPVPDGSTGTDPFTLPTNITVDDSVPINKQGMCDTSFQVTGDIMAEFPVTVVFADGGSDTVMWTKFGAYGYALGTNNDWLLVQTGDTWYTTNPWVLYTDENVSIKQVVLEPIQRKGKRSYAFDIGGKQLLTGGKPEHTPDAANGRPIVRKDPPSPKVAFTAVYSNPVYTNAHNEIQTDPPGSHDLYGTLTINFKNPVSGTEALGYLSFAFIADTDCLPVEGVEVNSYKDGILDFTVAGDGAVAVIKDGNPTGQKFDVSRDMDGGIKNFQIPFDPQPGSCYYMMDENTGEVMTPTYCAPN